jgi:hypothetical protein
MRCTDLRRKKWVMGRPSAWVICQMQVQNLYVSICKIIPEFNREPAANMHPYSAALRIVLKVISEVSRKRRNFPKAPEQILLLPAPKRSKEIQDFNCNQQA